MGGAMSIVLAGSTSGTITLQEPAVAGTNTLNLPAATGTLALTGAAVTSSQLPSGTVLQVVSVAKTDTFSTNSTTYVDVTGLSVSITPKFSTSKILITCQFNCGVDAAVQGIFMQFVRNSTPIFIGDAAGSRPQVTSMNGITNQFATLEIGGSFLDSPATTLATTYKIQTLVNGGGANIGYVNRGVADRNTASFDARAASSLTVMEIAG